MNSFHKYNSIENGYNKKFIRSFEDELREYIGPFIATEKVHGSNFQFHYDGNSVLVGKRNGYIGDEEKFYNHNIIVDRYTDSIKLLWDILGEEFILYGEIFGGNNYGEYKSKYSTVQKGVFYTTDIDFMTFDIYLVNPGRYIESKRFYEIMFDLTQAGGRIEPVPVIDIVNDINNLGDYRVNSWIPNRWGIIFEAGQNIMEGVVVKPYEREIYNGYGERFVLKVKNEEFKEKCRERKVSVPDIEIDSDRLELVLEYVNENRLNSVISKIGEVTRKDFGKLLGLVCKDVYEDFIKENECSEEEWKVLSKAITKDVRELILNYFNA
jgi:Rnl2 family RNA ligase